MSAAILVLHAGSSSRKSSVFGIDEVDPAVRLRGACDRFLVDSERLRGLLAP